MTADADYHRTFEKFVPNRLGMWPEFKRTTFARGRFHDRGKYAEVEEIAKASKAFYAYHRVGDKGLRQIRLMPKLDQDFDLYATEWEDTYSTLTSIWKQRVEPVVDDELKVAGHHGWWWASEILFPVGVPHGKVDHMIAQGIPMFAGERNPMPTYWRTAYDGSPQWKYLLLTSPTGQIESMLAYDVGQGAVATMAPWEYVQLGRAAVTLVGVGARAGQRYAISMFTRKGVERAVATGPTKELAVAAANRAGAARAAAESGTIHSVSVGSYGTPGHLIARIEVEEGKIVYRIAAIHLKAGGNAAEVAARAAHRDMLTRAAKEAQKRGQKEFTLRGIEAGDQFRAHANRLATESGVAGSGKVVQGSAAGPNYEVTLDATRVLSSGAQQTAAKAAAQAAPGAAKSSDKGFSSSAPTLVRTQGGRPVGRVSPEQMETYLLDVLAQRPDLRRLMAAKQLTGERLQQEVTAILHEWQFAQNWTVKYVEKGMASAASGRAGNPLWLNMKDKTLMVEKQIARDPQAFLSNVRHELTGHAVGGGHGAKTAFIQMANGQTWTAHVILKNAVEKGDLTAVIRAFSGGG